MCKENFRHKREGWNEFSEQIVQPRSGKYAYECNKTADRYVTLESPSLIELVVVGLCDSYHCQDYTRENMIK